MKLQVNEYGLQRAKVQEWLEGRTQNILFRCNEQTYGIVIPNVLKVWVIFQKLVIFFFKFLL
jgi:hypothetical protein